MIVLRNGIHETTEFLELFLRNLLLDEKNELRNRSMHICGLLKADIGTSKADIEKLIERMEESVRNKTAIHVIALFEECGRDSIFGRSTVKQITGLKSSRASELINLMLEKEMIEPVTKGTWKGKCRFK